MSTKLNFPEIIKSSEFAYIKPDRGTYLNLYNDMLARVAVENEEDYRYHISATINRLEAQTHFFEYLEKFVQLFGHLTNNAETNLIVNASDDILYKPLSDKFGKRILREKRSRTLEYINFCMRFLFYLIFTFITRLLFSFSKRVIKYSPYIIRSYYDFRNVDDKVRVRCDIFTDLVDDLSNQDRVMLIFRILNWNDLFSFYKLKNKSNCDIYITSELLSYPEIFKCHWKYLKSKLAINKPVIYKGIDITSLLNRSLQREFLKLNGLFPLTEKYIARKILKKGPKIILYPFENHTWEKMYPRIRAELKVPAQLVAFQHTGVSFKLLNYFCSSVDPEIPVFPDKVVCVGEVSKKIIEENAHFPSELIIGGALRHLEFVKNLYFPVKSRPSEIKKCVAYAFSYDFDKYPKILNVLKSVFENRNVKVLLRFHPLYISRKALRNMMKEMPSNFHFLRDMPWEEVYENADFVLYDDNTICVEGFINGVQTYMLECEQIYDCQRMFYFTGWETTVTPKDLEKLAESLENQTFQKKLPLDIAENYINHYFTAYNKEEHFSVFIER